MLITHCYFPFKFWLILVFSFLLAPIVQAQTGAELDGFFADVGFGYRDVNISPASSVIVNGNQVPSSLNLGQPSNTVSVFTVGYNLFLASNYVFGVGANISPAVGQAQQTQLKALNQTLTLPGIKPLYNYGFFLAPGVIMGDGFVYLKAGRQTQVNNSNTSPNFYGYLWGLGYKQLIYRSVYFFGEADYASYGAQTTSKTLSASGRIINASITAKPEGARYLLGLGYQF